MSHVARMKNLYMWG